MTHTASCTSHLRLTVCLAHTYLAQGQSLSTRNCRVSAPCRLGAMQAARQAFQQVARRSVQHVKGSRNMSSDASSEKAHLDEAMKEMSKWRTVTYAAVPTCIAVAAWDLTHQHEHHEEVPDYPYMRIRSKDFPWGPCGLFEMHCPDAEGGEE